LYLTHRFIVASLARKARECWGAFPKTILQLNFHS
jgi:hypothetical protein